jgi:hypothetical protein
MLVLITPVLTSFTACMRGSPVSKPSPCQAPMKPFCSLVALLVMMAAVTRGDNLRGSAEVRGPDVELMMLRQGYRAHQVLS